VSDIPLSSSLPGTWELASPQDRTAAGETRIEPSLGEDPVENDRLAISLQTAVQGETVTRTLTWKRVG
jgi:hypothetical protein